MLDSAVGLLGQLGKAGAVLEPQMFAVWKDEIAGRRGMLAMLDSTAAAAAMDRARRATVADLDQLADRYQQLYPTVAPAALLTSVAAHVRMTDEALRETTPGDRSRLLAIRARVGTLAG
jgi:hypothetical protein